MPAQSDWKASKQARRVYFAGELFDIKHLIGNHLLRDAIRRQTTVYDVQLPQIKECTVADDARSATSIRDHDLLGVLMADAAVFSFDGTELDSG
jgi:nucleoside 2-deoxyribosyltransferase